MTENQKLNIPQAIVLAGIIIAVAIFFKLPTTGITSDKILPKDTTEKYTYAWEVKPTETSINDHRLGSPTAQIVITEYSDTECPFCKNFHKTMHQVIDNYKGEVAWVYKHLPLSGLHKYAYNEAVATECAEEQGGNIIFWRYLDAIFDSTTSNDGLPPAMLPEIAESIELNKDLFSKCLLDPNISAQVDADIEEVKTLTDKMGTPFAVIRKDGVIVDTINGALSYAKVIEKIDAVKNK
ncbi:MAG: thioredoxin domain-containing protein [Candidatus Pacebacteria bacterium]|nr:thioredoxin domain-containing protein [Candidatus Paceibacterota bacterium]